MFGFRIAQYWIAVLFGCHRLGGNLRPPPGGRRFPGILLENPMKILVITKAASHRYIGQAIGGTAQQRHGVGGA